MPSFRRDISNLFRLSGGDYERFGCKFIISGNAERSVGTEKDRGNGWTIGLQFISNKSSGEIGWVSEHVLLGRGGWTRPWTAPPKTCRASHTPLHSPLRGSGSKCLAWGGKVGFFPLSSFAPFSLSPEGKIRLNCFRRNQARITVWNWAAVLNVLRKGMTWKKNFFFFFWDAERSRFVYCGRPVTLDLVFWSAPRFLPSWIWGATLPGAGRRASEYRGGPQAATRSAVRGQQWPLQTPRPRSSPRPRAGDRRAPLRAAPRASPGLCFS